MPQTSGRLYDLDTQLNALMRSDSEDAFLVIEIQDTEDFVQLLTVSGQLRLDWPLLTPRQRKLEPEVRVIAESLGLDVLSTSDADEFPVLDVDIPGDAAHAARVVGQFLERLYDVDERTPLRFELEA